MVTLPRTNRALNARARALATEYDTAMRAQTKTRTRQIAVDAKGRLDAAGIVPNDGVAPAPPTGVTVEAIRRGVRVRWSAPPEDDHVALTLIRLTNVATGAVTIERSRTRSHTFTSLSVTEHTVEVGHEDMWGLFSGYGAPVSVTPLLSVADEVDLAGLAMLGRLKGLLPNANLATIQDATRLGSGVVLAQAMAVQDAAAINLWVANAAIGSAKIASVVADKISAGILTADIAISTGGRVSAAGATMDDSGISLTSTSSSASFASQDTGSKITAGSPPWAALGFFSNTVAPFYRGMNVHANGVAGTSRHGLIRLAATDGNEDNSLVRTAVLTVESSDAGGLISVKEDLSVNRHITAQTGNIKTTQGNIQAGGRMLSTSNSGVVNLPSGTSFTFGFNRQAIPHLYVCFFRDGTDWRPFVNGTNGFTTFCNAGGIQIYNGNTVARDVRVYYYG